MKSEKSVFYQMFPHQIVNPEKIDEQANEFMEEFYDDRQKFIDEGKDGNLITQIMLIEQISKQRVIIGQLCEALTHTVANVNILANEHGYI